MSYISTQTVYLYYLELSQEKSSFIGNLPLVGVQQTFCCNGLNNYQPVFIIYNNQTSHKRTFQNRTLQYSSFMQNMTAVLLTSPETCFYILSRPHMYTNTCDRHALVDTTAGKTNKTLTCFGNKIHALTEVSARTFERVLKTEISHHSCALKWLLFSPGSFPPQDVNLIGHKYQSHRSEDDEENQESDQSFFIV